MLLVYNGVDIYPDISLRYCVHESYAERQSDSLTMCFNDPKGAWNNWEPVAGDIVSFEDNGMKTGKMYVHQLKPENGLFTIRALAMPTSGKIKRSKSWEAVRFLQLGAEIAQRHGLTLQQYGCTDLVYPYVAQNNETDFRFFCRLCALEGYQMILFDGAIIVYNESYIESIAPSETLAIGNGGIYQYSDASDQCYGASKVTCGRYYGTFSDASYPSDRVLRPAAPIQCSSNTEAGRFARGLLRNANKFAQTGSFSKSLLAGYSAASTVMLKTSKAAAWDGPAFISRIRNDYVKNSSVAYFRRITLEGY